MASDSTRSLVEDGLKSWDLPFTPAQMAKFVIYRDMLVDWNANRMNLTRLTSPAEIATEHFLDSLSLLKLLDISQNALLLDVGPGAGFPSLPIKIMRPDMPVTLLEGTAKKLVFCRAVVDALDLKGIQLIHGRAEDAPGAKLRGAFDIVTARAVAPLDKLAQWCEPYMKPKSGILAALKGSRAQEEIEAARSSLSRIGLNASLHIVNVPGSERVHSVVACCHRRQHTPVR